MSGSEDLQRRSCPILAMQSFQSLATQTLGEYFLTSSLTLYVSDVIMELSCNTEVHRGGHIIYCSNLDTSETRDTITIMPVQ